MPPRGGSAKRKLDTMNHIRKQLLLHPRGYSIAALVEETGTVISTVWRQIEELGGRRVDKGLYTLEPTPDDIALARAVLERAGQQD